MNAQKPIATWPNIDLQPLWGPYLNGWYCSSGILEWRIGSVLLQLQHFIASKIEYAHLGAPDVMKSKRTKHRVIIEPEGSSRGSPMLQGLPSAHL